MTNCPNCGAPITGRICEYCGTVHWQDDAINTADTGGLSTDSQKPASFEIETVADGKRVPVAVILQMRDSFCTDSYDEVECTSLDGTYLRYAPPKEVIFPFTVLQTDGTLRPLGELVNKRMEYYFVIRDKESKRVIVEYRVIGMLTFEGFGITDGTMDIVITAEATTVSRWEAV
nr:MAG TPA: hypothetical protein [Caudoviricetes sp.]